MPNLVQLYTIRGPVMIDTRQLCDETRETLTAYTADGERLQDVAADERERLLATHGILRDTLYASPELAKAALEKFWADSLANKIQ